MELIWDRANWGVLRNQGDNKSYEQRNKGNYYNRTTKSCTITTIEKRQPSTYTKIRFMDEEQFWSRGGEVVLNAAENLLKEIEKDDISETFSQRLLEHKVKIVNLLNNDKRLDKDLCQTLMKVILRESEENVFDSNFRKFLVLVLGTKFASKRIDTLINVDLVSTPTENLLSLVVKFLRLCFELFPSMAFDIFHSRVENLHCLVKAPSFIIDLNSETISDLEELKMLASDNCHLRYEGKSDVLSDFLQSPDNFREMSIFPTKLDLLINETKDVFLRKKKSYGEYKSVNHYLDVEFRLIREDFIRPLREGIKYYKNNIKTFNLRVYKNVKIMSTFLDRKIGILHKVQLDQSNLINVNRSESKCFLNGSLLCLSYDNFETFTLATVCKRNDTDLKERLLSIKFIDECPPNYREYTLLESTNLFENYRYVLSRLQEIKDETFCFKNYFINCVKKIELPTYLKNNRQLEYKFKDRVLRPGNDDEVWPPARDIEMNESQCEAFKKALTKELVIIQGPPGTGKTYLGLNICKCLLENLKSTLPNFGPILIVCYTNHALDQFLQKISEFTKKIVRIGGGCKSDNIRNFSVFELKKIKNDMKNDINNEEIINLEAELEFRRNAFLSLVPLERLKNIISVEHYKYFVSLRIDEWLKGESLKMQNEPLYFFQKMIVKEFIQEEVIKHLGEMVAEILNEPIQTKRIINEENDSDDDFLDCIYILPLYGFTLIKNKLTKTLFKKYLKKQSKMSYKNAADVKSLDELSLENRWKLYRYWRSLYVKLIKETTLEKEEKYEMLCKELNDLSMKEDGEIMKDQDIIGMTTTGAAKYGKVLDEIGCRIIIVEEAAEVMESHVIASLNSRCEHLILIGDHKQLKPNAAVYELAKQYSLDISLFERLINNELEYVTLSTQHRMRPEISQIMRFIYDDLQDDESVLHYSNVPAVQTNIFFCNHFEQEDFHEDILSFSNRYEAEYILKFCRYLLENGVNQEKVTILTLYSAQSFLLNSLKAEICDNIRVSVVDNYQGEENDIILLSLVRSNEYEQIGFLNIENRICVSLSRAKQGLYVFGNFDILSNKNQKWKTICQFLKEKKLLDTTISLFCQNHPTKQLFINEPGDFDKYPDCGCEEMCKAVLSCGYICPRYCHFRDRDHKEHKCMQKCIELCMKRGHEDCDPCLVPTENIIPSCDHSKVMICNQNTEEISCNRSC